MLQTGWHIWGDCVCVCCVCMCIVSLLADKKQLFLLVLLGKKVRFYADKRDTEKEKERAVTIVRWDRKRSKYPRDILKTPFQIQSIWTEIQNIWTEKVKKSTRQAQHKKYYIHTKKRYFAETKKSKRTKKKILKNRVGRHGMNNSMKLSRII